MRESRNILAILPDGFEYNVVLQFNAGDHYQHLYQRIAEDAVRKKGLTTPRNNPTRVSVKIFVLTIVNGELKKTPITGYYIMPPLERMTEEEYGQEMKEVLQNFPEEFQVYVSQTAYEDGHSAGYEEVVNIARNIVSNLKPVIDSYTKRIKG